jgi:hypothetical protein
MIVGDKDDLELAWTWLVAMLCSALGTEDGMEEAKSVPMQDACILFREAMDRAAQA